MKNKIQIAIDGGAGTGKSTVGRALSEKLGFDFIDSGLLYRVAALIVLEKELTSDKAKWFSVLAETSISFSGENVIVDGKVLTPDELHSKAVDDLVSPVSEVDNVRTTVTSVLRRIADDKSIVMVGRDIGTVVLSDATLKVYLTATDEERAARRFKELISKGINVTYEEVLANIKERDLIDSSRTNSPLLVAKDAYVVDTTNLAVDEVVNSILQFLEGKLYAIRNSSHHS
ncbi:MAG: (d)CMP kinase [Caldisericaceae bacterium]